MPYTDPARDLMLTELGTVAVYVSLHEAAPGTNGANELAGGDPAYGREVVSWGAAAGGEIAAANALDFNVPAGATIQYVGVWSAFSGGTFYGYDTVTTEEFANQGIYTVSSLTLGFTA